MRINFLFLLLLALTSCYKSGLYVQQEKIDVSYLASSYVNTPDPRAHRPFKGERLLVAWDFPLTIFRQKLSLFVTVRFFDQRQKVFFLPLKGKRGVESFYFPNLNNEKKYQILTYKVSVLNATGEEVSVWKHHFWTNLIDIDQEDSFSSQNSNSSVDSISKQESVIEQP